MEKGDKERGYIHLDREKFRVIEPFLFYVVLLGVLYWSFTSPPWPQLHRLAFLCVYMTSIPLIFTKIFRKERLGVKEQLRVPWWIYLGLLFGFSIYTMVYAYWSRRALIFFMMTVVLTPLAEELFYRAYMLGSLKTEDSNQKREIIVIATAAFCFSLIHMIQPVMGGRDVTYVIGATFYAFVFGMLLGAIFLRLKNITITILLHGTWNGFAAVQGAFLGMPDLIFVCLFLCILALAILDLYFYFSVLLKAYT